MAMRILYHHRIASRDGSATHVEEMVRALRGLGHEVQVCAPGMYEKDTGQGGSPGWVGALKAGLPKSVYELAEVGYSTVSYRRLRRAIKAFRPDVIYERYALFNLAGVLAARRYKVPLVLEVNAPYAVARRVYGGLKLGRLADACEAFVWRRATRVLPVTEVLADIIVAAGVPRERMTIIPNAIDPEHYANLPAAETVKSALGLEGRVVVGFTGFVREWDRLDRVLNWLAGYKGEAQPHLLIVGDGPVRAELEAQARTLGVADRLSFTGVVPRTRVPELAMAFDVALQTALVPYASPLCLFEYLALGKAIVAPDQPNHHEVLQGGVDALLYRPEVPGAMEHAIETLVVDAALRDKLADGARAAMDTGRFTWRRNAERAVEVMQAAIIPR
jgi:glycosyltransferase involved in cell wall biosynthesis